MKRLAALVLAFCLLLSLSACSASRTADQVAALELAVPQYPTGIAFDDFDAWRANREANPVSDASTAAVNQFSYQTAAAILKNTATNDCYSPLSLYFALALATSGANGQTQAELLTLLGESDPARLMQQSGNLYRLLYTDNAISKLKIANSLWLDNDYHGQAVNFKENFLKNAAAQLYASVFKVDFAQDAAANAMAQWIADHTNNLLQPTFEPDPEQILSIINTIYFRDEWVDRFDAALTKPDAFHLADGSDMTCDFMNMTYFSGEFSRGDGYTRSALGLKSNGKMVFILPDEGTAPADLLASPAKLQDAFEGGEKTYGQIVWQIPKFTCDSTFDLIGTLKNLGVTSAFQRDADFSGITDHIAYISAITQNTHLAIDEKGVEAAAFTKIDYVGAAMPTGRADMILNRPFIYGVYSSTGNLLFAGICGNPG